MTGFPDMPLSHRVSPAWKVQNPHPQMALDENQSLATVDWWFKYFGTAVEMQINQKNVSEDSSAGS